MRFSLLQIIFIALNIFCATALLSFPLVKNLLNPLTTTYEALTFLNFKSAGNCHPECIGGCFESNSSSGCFACKHFAQTFRHRAGFKCVAKCDDDFYQDGNECKKCHRHCKTCVKAEQCLTCHEKQLLIDADHIAYSFHHGQCVEKCPEGLISDYDSNLLQARCVLKKNPCSKGYYEDEKTNCVACDPACSTCHGPGGLKCDECAVGYSNTTYGFCRPCCGQTNSDEHCEVCSMTYMVIFFAFTLLCIGIVVIAIYYRMKNFNGRRSNDNKYSQLHNTSDEYAFNEKIWMQSE